MSASVDQFLQNFSSSTVLGYLESNDERRYPSELLDDLREAGIFGANIPVKFGGLGLAPWQIRNVTETVSRGWQSLAGLLGTHYRACQYVLKCGSALQQERWLPNMATGKEIWAHAYHEQGTKGLSDFSTTFEVSNQDVLLSGRKDWVTNARDADQFIVICSRGDAAHAVTVPTGTQGMMISDDLTRLGMFGISLCAVDFKEVKVPLANVIGDINYDVSQFIVENEPGSSIAFAARAVGTAKAAYDECLKAVLMSFVQRSREARGAIALRVGELKQLVSAMDSIMRCAADPDSPATAHEAKTFVTNTLQDVLDRAAMLTGGAAYASPIQTHPLIRHMRDGAALLLIDTPNDVLFSRIGATELGLDLQR